MYKVAAAMAMNKAAKKMASPVIAEQPAKPGWWASLEPEQRKFISNVAIGLGVSAVAVGVIYLGNKFLKGKIANAEEKKSFGGNDHSTWAKQIKNAFVNDNFPGTDEVLLRRTLLEIPSQQDFDLVDTSYKRMTEGESLIQTMTSELSTTEYDEMLAIIKSKPEKARDAKKGIPIYDPEGWAKRINSALNYRTLGFMWGTDEDAILAVVNELPTQKAFFDTAEEYEKIYGVKLMVDLRGDVDESVIDGYKAILLKRPKQ